MKKPPQSPHSSVSNSPRQSSSSSRKSRRTSSSDSRSASATNANGRNVLDARLRSVLSHPLGLPLIQALNQKDPGNLLYLKKESRTIANGKLDNIFEEAVNEWVESDASRASITEPQLTKKLSEKIEKASEQTGINSDDEVHVNYYSSSSSGSKRRQQPRIDILLSPRNETSATCNEAIATTPLALIEVGRHNSEWWKKLDQNTKYLDAMLKQEQTDQRLQFADPLLCAVLTIEGENTEQHFQVKFGVFLCAPKNNSDFRMTLLWHISASNLKEASEAFGQFIRVTSWFAAWRKEARDRGDHFRDEYQYLSSNCCRVGEKYVLRSYDSRFRVTDRSPEIYLSPECKSIVGEVETVIAFFADANIVVTASDDGDSFWTESPKRELQIIAVPYKIGEHQAKKPADFIPVIDQLQKLHGAGFVHGDIRAFNVVFGEHGGLIDFDFGGRPGKRYPQGYRQNLGDGMRRGSGKVGDKNNELAFWHDWYALGQLILSVHMLWPPSDSDDQDETVVYYRMKRRWTELESDPSPCDIDKLKSFLQRLDSQNWTVRPNGQFKQELDNILSDGDSKGTHKGATGSPPKNK